MSGSALIPLDICTAYWSLQSASAHTPLSLRTTLCAGRGEPSSTCCVAISVRPRMQFSEMTPGEANRGPTERHFPIRHKAGASKGCRGTGEIRPGPHFRRKSQMAPKSRCGLGMWLVGVPWVGGVRKQGWGEDPGQEPSCPSSERAPGLRRAWLTFPVSRKNKPLDQGPGGGGRATSHRHQCGQPLRAPRGPGRGSKSQGALTNLSTAQMQGTHAREAVLPGTPASPPGEWGCLG